LNKDKKKQAYGLVGEKGGPRSISGWGELPQNICREKKEKNRGTGLAQHGATCKKQSKGKKAKSSGEEKTLGEGP